MKMSFKKHSPIERHYRDYKYFDRTKFKNNLNEKLSEDIHNYESFETTSIEVLNKHAPWREKFLRANHAPYITKTLRKAKMPRFQLETKYLKIKTRTDIKLCKKHKNFGSKLYKRERTKRYEYLDMKNVLDNKEFWKKKRPFLSNKNIIFSQIRKKKIIITKLYLMILICLKSLALSLKILLARSLSSQMNII